MNSNLKAVLGVLLLIIVITFIYLGYSKSKSKDNQFASQQTELELGQLILKEHNCDLVIEKATAFLKTHSASEEVLSVLGACQFDRGLFADAKASFERVLSFNPNNEAAQNYLQKLDFKPGEVAVTSTEITIGKAEFETAFGVTFEPTLSFVEAMRKPASIPLYLSALYTSSKSQSQTVSALKTLLKGLNVTVSETDTGTILATGDGMKILMIKVVKKTVQGKVLVEMEYQKLQ